MTDRTNKRPRRGSHLEATFAAQWAMAGLPEPEREFRFMTGRAWRFDFAWPAVRVALEVEGNMFLGGRGANRGMGGGRHLRALGFQDDCVKYGAAAMLGWLVLRATGPLVNQGYALRWVSKALDVRARLGTPDCVLTDPLPDIPQGLLPPPRRVVKRVRAARSARG